MRVLGVDCGTEYTGFGVVELGHDDTLVCLTCGAIKLSPREPLPRRLATIFDRLGAIIEEHRPDNVAIEDVFYALNVKSALKLGQVRGVALPAYHCALRGVGIGILGRTRGLRVFATVHQVRRGGLWPGGEAASAVHGGPAA